jgi:hypothetical protein
MKKEDYISPALRADETNAVSCLWKLPLRATPTGSVGEITAHETDASTVRPIAPMNGIKTETMKTVGRTAYTD